MSVPLSPPEPLDDEHQMDGFDSGEPELRGLGLRPRKAARPSSIAAISSEESSP